MTEKRLFCDRNVTRLGNTKETLHQQVETLSIIILRRRFIATTGRTHVDTHHEKHNIL